ncbi:uncharacterized protein LOC115623083 isoform X2 [Scaptodrosophila lebanonensis]|uniref:Uncharacterized protein LOC115623083 isoform X2 n=1 Tax=Drosophila lebanonensis TaxID=7225 RepID=A0A6J2T8A1_DROLE|nr:uncharacterized protein LOC115623083 isoform X2 [Scaptodrosophila lebanonensis]
MSLQATRSSSISMTFTQNNVCSVTRTNSKTFFLGEQNLNWTNEPLPHTPNPVTEGTILQAPVVVNTINTNDRLLIMNENNEACVLTPTCNTTFNALDTAAGIHTLHGNNLPSFLIAGGGSRNDYTSDYMQDIKSKTTLIGPNMGAAIGNDMGAYNNEFFMSSNNNNTNCQRQYIGNTANNSVCGQPFTLQRSVAGQATAEENPHQTVINDVSNGSTVVGDDFAMEAMELLQGFNSGNFLHFNEQSVLRHDIKGQKMLLPTLENHNNGGYDFKYVLEEPKKSQWTYSMLLNKLYISMNKTFNIDMEFKLQLPLEQLNLRAFLCFKTEVSSVVLRCANHLSADTAHPKLRESLLRCNNPATQYCGTSQGRGIGDRYSVLVPLSLDMYAMNQSDGVRQTLAFEFTCQNSCLGRKETSLVFCLENISGKILGQQVLDVKICACPRRDRNQDERNLTGFTQRILSLGKRVEAPSQNDKTAVDCSTPKRHCLSVNNKQEKRKPLNKNHMPAKWQVSCSPTGTYRLTFECPNKTVALQQINSLIDQAAGSIVRSGDNVHHHKHLNNLLVMKAFTERLNTC